MKMLLVQVLWSIFLKEYRKRFGEDFPFLDVNDFLSQKDHFLTDMPVWHFLEVLLKR